MSILVLFSSTTLAKELRIGFADFPPFKYKEGDKNVGSDTEIVEAAVKLMGYEPVIDMKPWKRVQEDAKTGKYDMIYSFTQNPERDQVYYFSEPISTVKNVFFKRKGEAISWKELKDLEKYTIATSASYNYGPEFATFVEANLLQPHF